MNNDKNVFPLYNFFNTVEKNKTKNQSNVCVCFSHVSYLHIWFVLSPIHIMYSIFCRIVWISHRFSTSSFLFCSVLLFSFNVSSEYLNIVYRSYSCNIYFRNKNKVNVFISLYSIIVTQYCIMYLCHTYFLFIKIAINLILVFVYMNFIDQQHVGFLTWKTSIIKSLFINFKQKSKMFVCRELNSQLLMS